MFSQPTRRTAVAFSITVVAPLLAFPVQAQIQRKDLSVDTAIIIATTAMADCKSKGFAVSAAVVGRNGEILVHLRGDNTGPHTMENSFKKAFTSRTFRIASGEMEDRLKKNPQMGAQYLTGFTTGRGALPIGGDCGNRPARALHTSRWSPLVVATLVCCGDRNGGEL